MMRTGGAQNQWQKEKSTAKYVQFNVYTKNIVRGCPTWKCQHSSGTDNIRKQGWSVEGCIGGGRKLNQKQRQILLKFFNL